MRSRDTTAQVMQSLIASDFRGVGEDGTQRVWMELRIAREQLLLCPASGEKTQEEIDRQPRPAHDGLAKQDLGVGNDVVVPGHTTSIGGTAQI